MKISKAERLRRKEKKIYDHYDYLLSRLEKYYKDEEPYVDFKDTYDRIIEFTKGCYLADGRKWYKRLNIRFAQWLKDHQDIIKEHDEREERERKSMLLFRGNSWWQKSKGEY